MMKVHCPNCGTEFTPLTKEESRNYKQADADMDGTAFLVPKKVNNWNCETDKNEKEEENTNMRREFNFNEINNNNETKGENTMNGFNGMNLDMDALARMVAERINVAAQTQTTQPVFQSQVTTVDGGKWAKTSKYYGKEICGFIYNPYTIRRWIPKQLEEIVAEYGLVLEHGYRYEYSYMDGIYFLVEECKKLAKLQKDDRIAFDERKHFWSVQDMKDAFVDYLYNLNQHIYCKINNGDKTIYACGIEVKTVRKEILANHKGVYIYGPASTAVFDVINAKIKEVKHCWNYRDLHKAMTTFKMTKVPSRYEKKTVWNYNNRCFETVKKDNRIGFVHNKAFLEGFKKSGAYYSAKNDIMFNNLVFEGRTGREAVDYLRSIIDQPAYIIWAKYKEAKKNWK